MKASRPIWYACVYSAEAVVGALLAGDTETAATIMLMDAGMDTGPVLAQQRVDIGPDETAGALNDRLSHLGADLTGWQDEAAA